MNAPDESLSVALLSPTFWPEIQRGSERVIGDLASDLSRVGHRPRLITSHPGRPGVSSEYGFPVVRNWRPPEVLLRQRGFQEHLTHLPLTYRALTQGEDQVVHAFYPTDAVAACWAKKPDRPTVFSYMGLPSRAVLSARRLSLKCISRATRDVDAVVSLSRAAAMGLERWLGVESTTIYPAVDLDHFSPAGEKAHEPTIVCAASPDDPRKRIELLVRAFVRVRQARPTATLRIWRPRNPQLERELCDRSDGIEFFDADPDWVVAELRAAWVSVLPSYNEAFGLVLAEALACGTPGVGTDSGGIPEILDRPEVGRLFPDDDEALLAEALLASFELNEGPSTGAACRERAKAFGRERSLREHLGLYRELLSSV